MNIWFIQHESFEAPGAYLKWAEKKDHQVFFSKVYEHQPLPGNIENIDLLIIMGGPQSPDTSLDDCPHYNARAEMELIKKCIDAGKVVIGVCLGAQLIGVALGAQFEHSPEKEIGNFPIQLTQEGEKDNNLIHFGLSLSVGHWHSDMPGLTDNCKVLATSEGCPRQIIKYTDLVYGFQCHMEFTKDVVALLLANEANLEDECKINRFVQSPAQIFQHDYALMNEKLYLFLDKLTQK